MAKAPKVTVESADSPLNNLPEEVVEGLALGSLMSISQQPAMLSNLADANTVVNNNLSMQNAVSYQQAINEVGIGVLGKAVGLFTKLGALEATSTTQLLTGNPVAEEKLDLKAAGGLKPLSRIPKPVTGVVYANAPVSFLFLREDPTDLKISTSTVDT